MLPGDVKARKVKAERAQQTINSHLIERKLAERVLPYSDKLFKKAAIEWLVTTDQVSLRHPLMQIVTDVWCVEPIQAFEHPKFKEMIDVAARATNGVKIPGRKATRVEIIRIFKNHLTKLKKTLNVRHFTLKSAFF
jgi:hypothetical protein